LADLFPQAMHHVILVMDSHTESAVEMRMQMHHQDDPSRAWVSGCCEAELL
jgi:hypothetical protein